jgi:hypothetical protein
VRLEQLDPGELGGKIRGTEVATSEVVAKPDRGSTARAYGTITMSNGEVITYEASGPGSIPTPEDR